MNTDKKPITLLFNPFVYIAGGKALALGLLTILVASLLGSLSTTHFDGVLDTHTGRAAPLWFFLVEGVIAWLCLSLVLLILGRIISQTSFRSIDLLGTQALARWPTIFSALVCLPPAVRRFSNQLLEQIKRGGEFHINVADAAVFAVVLLAIIVFTCWMVALMYKSFSISCNVKGGKAIGTFIAGLLIAEILSLFCIWSLAKHALASSST
ncbi:MAG TPA: hypothetical protein VK615_06885 [Candidatus Binatia bacterium]|nr:hypothetical protein [Candidatus Binatia bacterium]